MSEIFENSRLIKKLRPREGRRQLILTGEIDDYFFVDPIHGLQKLEDAVTYFAERERYEVVLFLDRSLKPRFAQQPAMQEIFEQVVRGVSHDPQAVGRAASTFQPRSRRADNAAVASEENNSRGSTVVSDSASRAQAAAENVSQSAATAEQTTLDHVTRLLASDRKSLVFFSLPETMWSVDGCPANVLRYMQTIAGWSKISGKHPRNMSILSVNSQRLKEFRRLAEQWGDLSDFTAEIIIPNPDAREIEGWLRRAMCRHGLSGDAKRLAATACSQKKNLYTLSYRISDFLDENSAKNDRSTLDGLFQDDEQVQTLEEVLAELNGLIGLENVKTHVRELLATAEEEDRQRRIGKKISPRSYHMFFVGNPGTGKTIVARLIGKLFAAAGLRTSTSCIEIASHDIISAYNEGDTLQNMRDAIGRAMGGVLFIDEVYLFAENEWGRKALQVLMKEMEDRRDNLTVIMAGYEDRLQELFKVNPGFKSRVNETLCFRDYNTDEMLAIFKSMCRADGLAISEEAHTKIHRYIESFNRMGGLDNGRGVRNLFETTTSALRATHPAQSEIQADMVPDPICFREAEAQRVLADLENNFVGLPRVKSFLKDLFFKQRGRESKGSTSVDYNHCFFLGNPGTGKTSVARRMGQLFFYMGLISERDKLVEVDPISDMTSKYQSEYAEKIRKCFDDALGGVLFIDEAYQLADNTQGQEVIGQIVKLITEPRCRNLVVILAGYPDKMQELCKLNPGLKGRFPNEVHFDDFKPEELSTIFFQAMERDRHSVAEAEKEAFGVRLKGELARLARQRYFGNARAVQTYYEQVKTRQEMRLSNDSTADRFILTANDLTDNSYQNEKIESILDEMDREFVGLQPVKDHIRKLALSIKMDRIREAIRPKTSNDIKMYHMRFVGSPGTGKTTIARYMSRIFCSLGIISSPKVLERKGSDLKGPYQGTTGPKVDDLFEQAAGQVLLIDEAYMLASPDGGSQESFAKEAIDSLVACITQERNADTVIILAGYKQAMDDLMSINEGLTRRFEVEIMFPDFTTDECVEILYRNFEREGFQFPKEDAVFRDAVVDLIELHRCQPGFGNAGTIRGLSGAIMSRLDARVSIIDNPTKEELFRIELQDVRGLLGEYEC